MLVPSPSYASSGTIKSNQDTIVSDSVSTGAVLTLDIVKLTMSNVDYVAMKEYKSLGIKSNVIIVKKISNSYTKDNRKTKFLTSKLESNNHNYNTRSLYVSHKPCMIRYEYQA